MRRRHLLHKLTLLTGILALLTALLPLQVAAQATSPVLAAINERGVLRVAMSGSQPPYAMIDREGKLIGFDVDLAGALAKAMNIELDIVQLPFAELFNALRDGKADIAISGISITPERTQTMSFIGPYTLTGKSMLVTGKVKGMVTDGNELNNPEIRIVALDNSTSADFVTSQLPDASLYTIADYDEGVQQLLTGEVDAMVADIPILQLTLARYPEAGLGVIENPLSTEPIGIAIADGDSQLANLLRNYLGAYERMGFVEQLHKRWFDDNSWIARLP